MSGTHDLGPGRSAGSPAPTEPVLAVDLGATQVRAAVVLPDGTLASRTNGPTRSGDGPDAVLADIIALLRAARDAAPSDVAARLSTIGLAAPGPLDPRAGRLGDTPNFGDAFQGLALTDPVEAALGLPTMLERDTVVALLGEVGFGAARGAHDAIYVTVSTGIGGAVLSGGRLLAGADGMAGEVGHVTVDLDGPPCGCGGQGHLEAIASGVGLARLAAQRIAAGDAPGLSALATALDRDLTAKDLSEAEDRGDATAADLLGAARRAFAAGMVGLVNVFNPEVIVVGGSLAAGQGDRLLGPARDAIRREAFRVQAGSVRLVPAQLGDDVGLIGSLGLAAARAAAEPDRRRP